MSSGLIWNNFRITGSYQKVEPKMDKFILAIDQGTTGTTVCVLNREARMLASVNFEHPQMYPQPGWVEHDPEAIWKTVVDGIQQCLNKAGVQGSQIAGIGITNQ